MSPHALIPFIVFALAAYEFTSICLLIVLLADEPVFTRAAFADLRVMASRAMHRAPREPLRERIRHAFRDRTLPLDDLNEPLEHETCGPPCPLCLGTRTRKPCCCTEKCEHPFCEGEAA